MFDEARYSTYTGLNYCLMFIGADVRPVAGTECSVLPQ